MSQGFDGSGLKGSRFRGGSERGPAHRNLETLKPCDFETLVSPEFTGFSWNRNTLATSSGYLSSSCPSNREGSWRTALGGSGLSFFIPTSD